MKQKILFLFLFLFAAQIAIPAVVFADAGELYFKPEVLIPGMDTDGSGGAATPPASSPPLTSNHDSEIEGSFFVRLTRTAKERRAGY